MFDKYRFPFPFQQQHPLRQYLPSSLLPEITYSGPRQEQALFLLDLGKYAPQSTAPRFWSSRIPLPPINPTLQLHNLVHLRLKYQYYYHSVLAQGRW